MEPTTEMTSVLGVKCFIPSIPLSCCIMMIMAVPPMNPVIVDRDRKSTISPNLHQPKSRVSKKQQDLPMLTKIITARGNIIFTNDVGSI